MKHGGFVLGALLLVAGHGAPAWAVNKCVGADGRVTYTDSPCAPDSRVTRVDTPPLPTPGEQAEARARGEELVRDAQALEARRQASPQAAISDVHQASADRQAPPRRGVTASVRERVPGAPGAFASIPRVRVWCRALAWTSTGQRRDGCLVR